jgi:hypothetical protein
MIETTNPAPMQHTFGPANLAGVALHLEVFMAFRSAEAEDCGIIAHKSNTVPWVDS